jgi:RNA recognition motif-containing protein
MNMQFVQEGHGSSRNVAFIEFSTERAAQRAVSKLHNTSLDHHRIGVILCEQVYSRYSRIVRAMVPHETRFRESFIDDTFNVAYMTKTYGPTLSVFYSKSRKSGFITFANPEDAVRAVRGLTMDGFMASRRCDLEDLPVVTNSNK